MLSFEKIEKKRSAAEIRQNALCEEAKISETTYSRIKKNGGGRIETIKKLSEALTNLIEKRQSKLEEVGTQDA